MVVEKHIIGNKVEFRQYPPLVDKVLQYARTTCPHLIHNLWITCGQVILASAETCPQAVDIVETPLYFL
jgi:hypothetical protein